MARILCVEDEPDIREDIVDGLRSFGHEVLEADGGRQALDVIQQQRPDIVISDINMPDMNGAQLLVTLRQKHPQYDDMPVIFLTAFADREHVIKGTKLGVDDYLTKPVDYELLAAKVDQHLANVARVRQKHEGQAIHRKPAIAEPTTAAAGSCASILKNLHSVEMVVIGGMNHEQRQFLNLLSLNGFKVLTFMDELSYFRKAQDLGAHFVFLWNYTYGMNKMFDSRMAKKSIRNICVRVVPETPREPDDFVAINGMNHILKLPASLDQVEAKMIQLVQEKITAMAKTNSSAA